MSGVKRRILSLGAAVVLLSGMGAAAAASASAESRSGTHAVDAPSDWYYAATYRTLNKCVAAGRSSGQPWTCNKVAANEYALWLKY